jgi:hypothetical protein
MAVESYDQAQLNWQRYAVEKGLVDPPRDPSTRARVVKALLAVNAALAALAVVFEVWHLVMLGDSTADDWAATDKFDGSDLRLGIVYVVQFLLWLVTAGFFMAWLHRVYKNVVALGAYDLRHGPGWAIGSWFVPILNLFRPKEIVNDAWRGSDPELPPFAHRRRWVENPVPPLFLAWWLIYLLSGALDNTAGRLYGSLDIDQERTATIVALAASAVTFTAALLAIRTVTMITDRQNARAAARERMAPPVPPVPQGPPPPPPPPAPPPASD